MPCAAPKERSAYFFTPLPVLLFQFSNCISSVTGYCITVLACGGINTNGQLNSTTTAPLTPSLQKDKGRKHDKKS